MRGFFYKLKFKNGTMFINIQVYNAEKQACKIFPRIYGVIDKSVLEIQLQLEARQKCHRDQEGKKQ